MPRLAKSFRVDSQRPACVIAPAEGNSRHGAAGIASTSLMAVGSGLAMPRLDGVPVEQQLWQGEAAAARLARNFVEADVAGPDDWVAAKHNPFEFLKRALDGWLTRHGATVIREQFFLDVLLSTSLDRYFAGDGRSVDASKVFLALEPDSAGYVILGPTLRLLEGVHPRLPATFLNLFLGALNRWVRAYDYRDAFERVERLREWYESDPDGEAVELPDIDRSLPKSVKRRPLSRRTLGVMIPAIKDSFSRQLMELAFELDRLSSQSARPEIGDDVRELLIDCGEPVPALLAVFERTDAIEGCFDEECQGMLELTPEPNLIVPFDGQTESGVRGAFAILSAVCETLSCASRLMKIMPGNERLN
jgi:hypothetical protein